jgi:hypothetical protein
VTSGRSLYSAGAATRVPRNRVISRSTDPSIPAIVFAEFRSISAMATNDTVVAATAPITPL